MATEPAPAGRSVFELRARDAHCAARRGIYHTPRGSVELPAFMPVGTQGTVKGLTTDQLRGTGAAIVLANTYHLALRPGAEVVRRLGGLHAFMQWNGPILTDSGGFQVFSLAAQVRVDDEGAAFRSHIDGRPLKLAPEDALEIQRLLGSDIAMVLDHIVGLPAESDLVRAATQRTVAWARRSRDVVRPAGQALFGIVQGGLDPDLRTWCAEQLTRLEFDGYAIGGLAVGETTDEMYHVLEFTVPLLPADRPRYLMGVGRPTDVLAAIGHGIDMLDCVMPTRNGRNALAFTDAGSLRLRNQKFEHDDRPLEPGCPCIACRHSRGYLRHLFMAREMLGPILLSIHNLTYYQRLVEGARQAIEASQFREYCAAKRQGWGDLEGGGRRTEDGGTPGMGSF